MATTCEHVSVLFFQAGEQIPKMKNGVGRERREGEGGNTAETETP